MFLLQVHLFRTALGVLRAMEPRLLGQPFETVAHELTHLPQTWDIDEFLATIDRVDLTDAVFETLLASVGLPPPNK